MSDDELLRLSNINLVDLQVVAPHLLIVEVGPFEDVALTLELNFVPPLWVHVVIGAPPVVITMTPGILQPLRRRSLGFRSNIVRTKSGRGSMRPAVISPRPRGSPD